MKWKIKIHKLVLKEDFKKIDIYSQRLIVNAIRKKLQTEPEKYGKPLHKDLKGFWKLKVSDYRVIYRIEKEDIIVLVVKVGIRRDDEVYKEMLSRLKHLFG